VSGTTPDDESYQLAGLAGLYALDALEGDDLARFEAHLANNVELQEEVAGFRATAARLADVSAASPPPGLRGRVLADVATTRQESPIVHLDERRRRTTMGRAVLAAAAVVAVLAAGLGGYLIADTGDAGDGGVLVASELSRVLAREDAEVVPLVGVGSDAATGQVVVSKSSGKIVIVSDSMPPVAEGRTYEVWKVDAAGAAHQAGLFEPGADGRVEVALDVGLDDAVAFAVTDEPDGGSPHATTPVLMQARLA